MKFSFSFDYCGAEVLKWCGMQGYEKYHDGAVKIKGVWFGTHAYVYFVSRLATALPMYTSQKCENAYLFLK